MKFTIETKGTETVIRGFKTYSEETRAALVKAVRLTVNAVHRKARANIHNRTGNLRRGIKKNFDPRVISGTVRSRAPHGHLVEFGTKGKGEVKPRRSKAFRTPTGGLFKSFIHKGMKPRPYLRPAFLSQQPKYIKAVQKAVEVKE